MTDISNNAGAVREALAAARAEALEAVGQAWVANAANREGVFEKWGAALKESIAHEVVNDTLSVGSDLDIAAYAELGTGPHYAPPPEWLENRVPKGGKVPPDAEHWIYRDPEDGAYKVGAYQPPTPFLRPALEENREAYRRIIEDVFRDAGN